MPLQSSLHKFISSPFSPRSALRLGQVAARGLMAGGYPAKLTDAPEVAVPGGWYSRNGDTAWFGEI